MKTAERLAPYGRTITDAANYLIKHLDACLRSCTVSALISEFYTNREGKRHSHLHLKDIRLQLGRFGRTFGDRNVATISTREIEQWLNTLHVAPRTQNNYRRMLSAFFSYAVTRGYAPAHPVVAIEAAKVVSEPPGILTPKETAALLQAAMDIDPQMMASAAIGAFAGLRTAEIERLDWKDIDLVGGHININAKTAKSAKRRLVKIEPNLNNWLEKAPVKAGKVAPHDAYRRLVEIREKAEILKWPPNALRHSYASYHLAQFKDAARLALEMGHVDTRIIFADYREVVRPVDAEQYWKLEPTIAE
jgi:integrase